MFEREKQGAVHVVRGDTPLNATSVDQLASLLDECLADGLPRIVFDMRKVPLVDSAGIELLLDCRDRCQRCGGDLKLATPNRLCEDIFFVTGVDQDMEIHPDVLKAVGSFVR